MLDDSRAMETPDRLHIHGRFTMPIAVLDNIKRIKEDPGAFVPTLVRFLLPDGKEGATVAPLGPFKSFRTTYYIPYMSLGTNRI